MAAKWCRPASVPVPTVWRECNGLKPLEDGRVPRFVIQDVPEDRHEDFVEFMAEHFFRDEVTCECLHLQQDLQSVEELKQVYREVLKENVALVAFIKGEDGQNKQKIAGLNLLAVANRSEKLKADMTQCTGMSGNGNKWRRPSSVPVPTVWREPVGLKPMADGKVPRFIIQDVPENMHEEVIQFMTEFFLKQEPLSECLNFMDDELSVKDQQDVWRHLLKQNVGVVAFLKQDDPTAKPRIVGCNVTGVSFKDEPSSHDKFSGTAMRRLMQDLKQAYDMKDPYQHYGVTEYMSASGLSVDPEFRGQGLGLEILKARFDIGKAVGLKATLNSFTSTAAQKLAAKVGMEVLAELPYDEFKDEEGQPVYKGIETKTVKVMGKKI